MNTRTHHGRAAWSDRRVQVRGCGWEGVEDSQKGHRVHFQVVALGRSVDTRSLSEHPTKDSFRGRWRGLCWGGGRGLGVGMGVSEKEGGEGWCLVEGGRVGDLSVPDAGCWVWVGKVQCLIFLPGSAILLM
jgi:hypothetical protein